MTGATVAAIVLGREDAGDSDRRLTVLTRELGKLTVYAKGSKKPGSRLAGVTEPLTFARLQFSPGRKYRFLSQAQTLTSHPKVRADYECLMAALAIAELAGESVAFESPDEQIFDLVALALDQAGEHHDPQIVLVWFAARLLEAQGHMPEWSECADTKDSIASGEVWVSPRAGGSVADDVSVSYADSFKASREALIGINKISALALPPRALKRKEECLSVLLAFWQSSCGARLRAFESARASFVAH